MDPHKRAEDRPANPTGRAGSRLVLALTLLFVLAVVSVSTGLVVYTALNHEFWNGLFALVFAVLSAKAAFLWLAWRG